MSDLVDRLRRHADMIDAANAEAFPQQRGPVTATIEMREAATEIERLRKIEISHFGNYVCERNQHGDFLSH